MNKKIISSGLTPDAFGRTRMSNLLDKSGAIFSVENDGKIEFSEWKFSGTEIETSDEKETVWFCGEIFDNAKSLSKILEEKPDFWKKAVISVEKILSKAIEEKLQLGEIGGGGIILNEDCTKILVLPYETFEQSSINKNDKKGDFYSKEQGFYIYKGLSGTDQTIFTRAVIAYKALTGNFPYSKTDLSERQTDIFDRNFIPLSYSINGIDEKLADSIDAGLSIPLKFEPIPGEKRYKDEKAEKIRQQLLGLSENFDEELFEKELLRDSRKVELPEEEFLKRTEKFLKSKKRTLSISRFYRRNKTRIFVSLAIAALVIWGIDSYLETNGTRATTAGLTSTEAAQVFYSLTHRANSVDLDKVSTGKELKDFNNIISGFYVTNKERESFNAADRTVQPEEWLFYKTTSNYWMFGITNLKIDGKAVKINCHIPKKNEKNKPITEENGFPLSKATKGETRTHEIEYNLIHTDSVRINIDRIVEKLTLQWNGKEWRAKRIESIEGKSKTSSVKSKVFAEEYQKLLDENNGSVKKATEQLREKYQWIPADFDLEDGAKILFEDYKSTAAEQFLAENGNLK